MGVALSNVPIGKSGTAAALRRDWPWIRSETRDGDMVHAGLTGDMREIGTRVGRNAPAFVVVAIEFVDGVVQHQLINVSSLFCRNEGAQVVSGARSPGRSSATSEGAS